MKTLNVDFAPRRKSPAWRWQGVAALLLVVAAAQAHHAWQLAQQVQAAEARLNALRIQTERSAADRQQALQQQQTPPAYAKDAAELAKLAAFPVEQVFAALESAQVQGVRLSSLEVLPAEATARAEIEFSDHEALLRYLDALNTGEQTPRWILAQARLGGSGGTNTATVTLGRQ
jgi:hypothetical protein